VDKIYKLRIRSLYIKSRNDELGTITEELGRRSLEQGPKNKEIETM
jgi:hypothetical protein